MKSKKFLLLISLVVFVNLFTPVGIGLAQTPSSTNYRAEDLQIDFGGGNSTSSNYGSTAAVSAEEDASSSSANYKNTPGFILPAYPGVPAQPTLTNTGGTLYNSLDFVIATGGDKSDTNYAVAISPDNFVTTYFIQGDDTISTSTVWQTYGGWGSGTGQRVTGLSASTTYNIKVKARYGNDSETRYSLAAAASTVGPNFTMTISGVTSNTNVAGATTTISTASNSITLGSLIPGTPTVAAQQITVTTNAAAGYTTTIQENNDLTNENGQTISPVSGSNSSPASFPGSVSTGAFGYHTTDATLCTGVVTRFSGNNTYAAVTTSPLEIACNQAAITNDSTYIVYEALIGTLQASGSYSNTITYISTGKY